MAQRQKDALQGYQNQRSCESLNINLNEWQEIVSVCSGPPLEINDQANPCDGLGQEEIDFATRYLLEVEEKINNLSQQDFASFKLFKGSNSRSGTLPNQVDVARYLK